MNAVLTGSPVTPIAEHQHPLLGIVPASFRTFEEWLERWKLAKYQAEMLGLLHCLTDEDNYILCHSEGVSFLLEIADGYSGSDFSNPDERHGDGKASGARKTIAQKAFQVLCLRFFRGKTKNHLQPFWWWMVKDETLLQKVLWFLRQEGWHRQNFWFQKELVHPYDLFEEFLEEFPRLGWEFASLYRRYEDSWPSEENEARMVALRPQFIQILEHMHRLSWLSTQEIDDASVNKLTELAMEEKYSFPHSYGHRKADSLEEAALGGSAAAKVLLLSRILQKERKRLDALSELEQERRALDEKAKKLNKK